MRIKSAAKIGYTYKDLSARGLSSNTLNFNSKVPAPASVNFYSCCISNCFRFSPIPKESYAIPCFHSLSTILWTRFLKCCLKTNWLSFCFTRRKIMAKVIFLFCCLLSLLGYLMFGSGYQMWT